MRDKENLIRGQSGVTLIEYVLSIAISAIVLSGLSMMIYQFHSLTRKQQESLTLNRQLQSAAALLNRDVVGATNIVIENGTPIKTLSLSVPQLPSAADFGHDVPLITHTVVYSYSSDLSTLTRHDLDGELGPVTVARQVSVLDWQPGISNTLQITITALAKAQGGSEVASRTTTLTFHRRPSES